jgi:hypothetical protein
MPSGGVMLQARLSMAIAHPVLQNERAGAAFVLEFLPH